MSNLDDLIQKAANSVDAAHDVVEALALELDPTGEPPPPPLTDDQRTALDSIAEDSGNIADMTNGWLQG